MQTTGKDRAFCGALILVISIIAIPSPVEHDYGLPSTIGYDDRVPRFAGAGARERLWRRINRLRDSFAKRRKFPAHLSTVRRRLAASDE